MKATIRGLMHYVFPQHHFYELEETQSGANVELDTIAQLADDHKVIVIEDVLSNGTIASVGDGYVLRRNIHLSFVSKIQLDERGEQRMDGMEELMGKTTNAIMHLLNELVDNGFELYGDITYQTFTNRNDANFNMIDVQMYVEEPITYCWDYD